jgi:glutathione S-transferase
MAKPHLYGMPGSRAQRSIWGIEEVGVPYDHTPTHFAGESKKPDYLAINPNGRVPALVDGDLTLFESMAINLYLAKTYGGELYPRGSKEEALTWQWSVWGLTELEPHLMQLFLHRLMLPEEKRRPEAVGEADKALGRPLKVLDAQLQGRDWLVGDGFTIADLNVASVLMMSGMVGYDIAPHTNVKRWFEACTARPSFARAQSPGS